MTSTQTAEEYDPAKDSHDSYYEGIAALRTELELEIAIKTLRKIKELVRDNNGSKALRVFVMARDCLIQIGANQEIPARRAVFAKD